ncbi:MAG: MlaD family protein [Stellaceae bacterium]
MSELGPETHRPRRTEAVTRRARWPGWIWAIPVAAAGIAVWLLVREISFTGVDISVRFSDAAGVAPNNSVTYRGVKIGKVNSVHLSKDGRDAIADIEIDNFEKKNLLTHTIFYLVGAHPTLSDLASLKAIVSGPSIDMVPGGGQPRRHFVGVLGDAPPDLAVELPYEVKFPGGAVGTLRVGSPVTFRGFVVGEIDRVSLSIDPANGKIATPVRLMLDPTRLNISSVTPAGGNWASVMKTAMAELVAHGLRADLEQSPPLIGGWNVALVMKPDATAATLDTSGHYPEIPVAPTGGGIGQVVSAIGKLPLAQIGENVREITAEVKKLVSSPDIEATLKHVGAATAEIDKIVRQAGPQITPTVVAARETMEGAHRTIANADRTVTTIRDTVRDLRHTAASIDAAAAAVKRMAAGGPKVQNGSLQQTLEEMTRAARAVRTLANDLDRHPTELLEGR